MSTGDPAGVGPEVSLRALGRALERPGHARFVLVGDRRRLDRLAGAMGLLEALRTSGRVDWLDPGPGALPEVLEPGGPVAAEAAMHYLRRAAVGCLEGEFAGLITAPVSKEAILRAGVPFVGQTEYLAGLAANASVGMMLLGDDDAGRWLRVLLATTHLPLRKVPDALTFDVVSQSIDHAAAACRSLGLARARIAVCGLNPHAGEGGMLGGEDRATIAPAVEAARRRGIEATGPLSGDTVFRLAWRGDYDVVVAMYHDQGLAPLKLVAFERGVNWTVGLPFVRTSPDHGTAFDIAGRGMADSASMEAAIRLAEFLAARKEAGV